MAPFRRSWTILVCSAVVCLFLVACEEGGANSILVVPQTPGDADPFDMTGTWSMSANPDDPMRVVFDCTGDLDGASFSFCDSFEVTLTQDGTSFVTEEVSIGELFCDSGFAMSGTATIQEIEGTIERTIFVSATPPLNEIQTLEFRSMVVGDAAVFALVRITVRDLEGVCTLGGSYLGERVDTP